MLFFTSTMYLRSSCGLTSSSSAPIERGVWKMCVLGSVGPNGSVVGSLSSVMQIASMLPLASCLTNCGIALLLGDRDSGDGKGDPDGVAARVMEAEAPMRRSGAEELVLDDRLRVRIDDVDVNERRIRLQPPRIGDQSRVDEELARRHDENRLQL